MLRLEPVYSHCDVTTLDTPPARCELSLERAALSHERINLVLGETG